MWYFEGQLELSPALNPAQVGVINRFSKTRHGGSMIGFRFSTWCNWVVTSDGKYLHWNGGEFYAYVAWLHHLNMMFFTRWQVTLSGEIRWKGEVEKDVGLITATPVIQEDGIRTTEIHPPTQLLDHDLDDMEEEDPPGLENSFIIHRGFLDLDFERRWDAELTELAAKFAESNGVTAIAKARWKLVGYEEHSCHKRYLKWEDGQDDLHGCIDWLHWFVSGDNALNPKPEKHFLVGSVTFPGGLVITARMENRSGKCVNRIRVSSPLLATPSLPPALEQENPGNSTNGLALLGFGSLEMYIEDLAQFMKMKHGDVETSEPWIVPGSLSCNWRVKDRVLVWRGGDDDLHGCVHWLHELNLRFFKPKGVLLVGSVRLPNGVVVKAEVERRGRYVVTRITPKLPRYEHVKVGGEVELREVDARGWRVKCRVVSCRGNCGWFEEQQEVPLRRDFERKCPSCGQDVLWTKKLVTKRCRGSGDGGDDAAPDSKRCLITTFSS